MSAVIEQGDYKFKREPDGKLSIFDPVRNKFVTNTPEEWVRQNTINYFTKTLGFPKSVLGVETQFKILNRVKRTDLVAYDVYGKPFILVECKRPSIKITQATFEQAFAYNHHLQVPFIVITNGEELYCCDMRFSEPQFIKDIPTYSDAQ